MSILWYYFGKAFLGVLLSLLLVSAAIPLFSRTVLIDQSLWSTATDSRVKLITSVRRTCRRDENAYHTISDHTLQYAANI